ncbi:MAG: ribosome small subunit-dependent GTPase A [Bacteroidales bacterium]|nr:ribosome small subunit-dependent GTPase A [Bacteroidales bacterium]
MKKGLVLKVVGKFYTVLDEKDNTWVCVLKGKLRLEENKSTNPVVVGDWVLFEPIADKEGVIVEALERKNYVVRKSVNLSKQQHIIAANIDCAYLVVTLIYPETNYEFIDRYLVTCEAYRVPAALILNKCDLYEQLREQVAEFENIYRLAGYKVFKTSAKTGEGIQELKQSLKGKINLVSGNSGVGKSSLINALQPGLNLKVQEISYVHFKGKHTTTFSQMFALDFGGYIIDTPGIKGFSFVNIEKKELFHFFPEILSRTPQCKYYNCTHTTEPDCAVKNAVINGEIHEIRYRNYVHMFYDEDEKHRVAY